MSTEKRHLDSHLMLERLSKIHAKIKSGCYPNPNHIVVITLNKKTLLFTRNTIENVKSIINELYKNTFGLVNRY